MKKNLAILVIFLGLILVINLLIILASLNVFNVSEKDTYSKSGGQYLSSVIIDPINNVKEDISKQDFLFVYDSIKSRTKKSSSAKIPDNKNSFQESEKQENLIQKPKISKEDKIKSIPDELYITDYEDKGFGSIDISDESSSWVYLDNYSRFDLYINEDYYNNNYPEIVYFFDDFEERFDFLESLTHWSSEKAFGTKLKIYVSKKVTTGCSGGQFYPGPGPPYVSLVFSDPLYKEGCDLPYIENGIEYGENSGELGDWWGYMYITLHEATHAITPKQIFYNTENRKWLAEGWGVYNGYNILTMYGDINQETSDYYIYYVLLGNWDIYKWEDYIANDYHDGIQREIQQSSGYEITAWMFSMLRNNHSLDWESFYDLMLTNEESMEKAWTLAVQDMYVIDTHIIDLLGRASGMSFNETQAVFRYDGPEGLGWGVRNWENLDWYADLVPELSFSNPHPNSGDEIDLIAKIYNYGDVSLNNISVRFYNGEELLNEELIIIDNVPANSSIEVSTIFYSGEQGTYIITVRVDEDNIKIELNETNNEDSESIFFAPNYAPVLDPFDDVVVNEGEMVLIYPVASDQNNDTLFYHIDSDLFVWNEDHFEWQTNQTSSGEYDFLVNVTDGELWDEQPVHVTVNNVIDFICGDANGDKTINILDITYIINYLYKNGSEPVCEPNQACGDPDGSGAINILDVTRIINYLYKGGQPPVEKPGVCENL